MKKITVSIIAALAMNAFAFAGGDIAPVEPEVTVPEVVESTPGAFYVGLGYSYMNAHSDPFLYEREATIEEGDLTSNSLLLLAGYKYNQYLGLEARYTMNVDDVEFEYDGYPAIDLEDSDMTNIGIYAKGMYPVTEELDVYALLGYGQVTIDTGIEYFGDLSESGFQWGLGASYDVTENIGVFADYTRLYDDTGFDGYLDPETDVVVDSINVGMTYTF
ncbi:MAG: hypothetical protein QG564_827 [Campylobacterota bacterium]|nr:hypothetical protein [Campylobacterota bacterium]